MMSASLGYTVHAVDVQPLCSRHVLTSTVKNGFQDKVHIHNIGISTIPGEMEMNMEQCKGGLSFDTAMANNHVEKYIHNQVG